MTDSEKKKEKWTVSYASRSAPAKSRKKRLTSDPNDINSSSNTED